MSGTYQDPHHKTTFTFLPTRGQWSNLVLNNDGVCTHIRWVEKHFWGPEKGNYRVWGGGWFIPNGWKINDTTEYTLKEEVHIYPDWADRLLIDAYNMVKTEEWVKRIVFHLQDKTSLDVLILKTKKLMHYGWKLVEEASKNLFKKRLIFERLPPTKTPPPPFDKDEMKDRYYHILNECFKNRAALEVVNEFVSDLKTYLQNLKSWSNSEGRDYIFIDSVLVNLLRNHAIFIEEDEKSEFYRKASPLGEYLR